MHMGAQQGGINVNHQMLLTLSGNDAHVLEIVASGVEPGRVGGQGLFNGALNPVMCIPRTPGGCDTRRWWGRRPRVA